MKTLDKSRIQAAQKGDVRAFKQLVDEHERLVFHVVTRLIQQPQEEVEDLCQEIFMRVFEKLKQFQFESKLSTWIAQLAYRYTLNHLRKTSKNAVFSDPEPHSFEWNDPEVLYLKAEKQQWLHDQIEQLPAQYKTVLLLFHIEEMTLQEIEQVTQWPIGTIKNYLFRARKLLKEQLVRYHNRNKTINNVR